MARAIKFSKEEIEMLITNYQMELGQALDYVEEIKAMLSKLGAPVEEPDEKPTLKKEKKKNNKK